MYTEHDSGLFSCNSSRWSENNQHGKRMYIYSVLAGESRSVECGEGVMMILKIALFCSDDTSKKVLQLCVYLVSLVIFLESKAQSGLWSGALSASCIEKGRWRETLIKQPNVTHLFRLVFQLVYIRMAALVVTYCHICSPAG